MDGLVSRAGQDLFNEMFLGKHQLIETQTFHENMSVEESWEGFSSPEWNF